MSDAAAGQSRRAMLVDLLIRHGFLLIMVGFFDAFLNQFLRDVFIIFRSYGGSFLPGRYKRHLPIPARFLMRWRLLRARCSAGKVLARTGPVEIVR